MSQLVRIHYEDRESWLAGRSIGIGASEAAAVLGQSPWMTTMQLWKLKIGATQPKDLSGNPAVELGNRMEDAIRNLYAAQHPELEVSHYPYDILYQDDRPYIFATLDGELVRKETGQKGILEVKTSTPTGKVGWGKWQNKIPDKNEVEYAYLDMNYPVAEDFERVYIYLSQRMVEANMKKDLEILQEINGHLHAIRDNWKEVMRINREQKGQTS